MVLLRSAAFAAAALAVAAVVFACGSDDDAPRRSNRGEACQVTNDCADGLACAPLAQGGGVCVTGEFHVEPTAKSCFLDECSVPSDCCSANPIGCAEGTTLCTNGTCVNHCDTDTDCSVFETTRHCGAGTCVQCTADTDCDDAELCNSGACEPSCAGDGDCSGFDRCVAGRCLASGCQTDRECIASTRNVDAKCKTDGTCIVPCQTDLECGYPTAYDFYSCIANECTYVGCVSDKDCRLFLTGDASLGPNEHVSCRDPGIGAVSP